MLQVTSQSYDVVLMLCRHAQTDWNKPEFNLMQGRSDGPENELNAEGEAQAQVLAEKICAHHSDISPTIYSSNLRRAIKTAQYTADKFRSMQKPVEVKTRADLQECDFGDAEGKSYDDLKRAEDELMAKYPERQIRWSIRPVPNMETYHVLTARAKKALTAIAEEQLQRNAQTGHTVAVFTSGRIIRILLTDIQNQEVEGLPNCGALHLGYSAKTQSLHFLKRETM